MERGLKAEKLFEQGKKLPETEVLFLQFLQSVRQSTAQGKQILVAAIFSQIKERCELIDQVLFRGLRRLCVGEDLRLMERDKDKIKQARINQDITNGSKKLLVLR